MGEVERGGRGVVVRTTQLLNPGVLETLSCSQSLPEREREGEGEG